MVDQSRHSPWLMKIDNKIEMVLFKLFIQARKIWYFLKGCVTTFLLSFAEMYECYALVFHLHN